MADFNITDRYAQQIKNVTSTEGLGNLFPLLARIPKSGADLLQTAELQGVPIAKLQGQPNQTQEIDEQSFKILTPQGFGFGVEIQDAGNLTASGVESALETVRNTLWQTVEAHLIWGRVHSSIAKSPIRGAVLKQNSSNLFTQSGDDVLFVQDNNLESVADGITKYETQSFKYYNTEGQNVFKKILINPRKGILVGNLEPEFKITKNIRGNNVVVFGTVSVCGGFLTDGAIKTFGGN